MVHSEDCINRMLGGPRGTCNYKVPVLENVDSLNRECRVTQYVLSILYSKKWLAMGPFPLRVPVARADSMVNTPSRGLTCVRSMHVYLCIYIYICVHTDLYEESRQWPREARVKCLEVGFVMAGYRGYDSSVREAEIER